VRCVRCAAHLICARGDAADEMLERLALRMLPVLTALARSLYEDHEEEEAE
jgi:hypothetical protein